MTIASRTGLRRHRVFAMIFVGALVIGIFVTDLARRWWKENEWKRRLRDRDP
jgi:hypothetical protein